jgi:hypothetical protein
MIERLRERPFSGAVIAAVGKGIDVGKQVVPGAEIEPTSRDGGSSHVVSPVVSNSQSGMGSERQHTLRRDRRPHPAAGRCFTACPACSARRRQLRSAPPRVQFATDIGSIVDTLQAKGAERIIVWDAVNLVLAPAITANGPTAAYLATTLTQAMNDALGYRLATESNVLTFGVFGLTTSISANPAAYGLTNDNDAGGAIPGADLSTFLFWDGIHPTAAGHAILTTSMVALTMSVPEIDPAGGSSVVALVIGVLGLIERRRPTRARVSATHRSPAIPR